MARITKAVLVEQVAELEHELRRCDFVLNKRNDELHAAKQRIADLEDALAAEPVTAPKAREGSCKVYLDGRWVYTALSHSEAYRAMKAARDAGRKSVYAPMH